MKVLASPFEPPRGVAASEEVERIRAHDREADDAVAPPAALSEVHTELDSSTRRSLSRLASLIRSQQKAGEAADDAVKTATRRNEEESAAREARAERALKAQDVGGEDEAILRERVAKEKYPNVELVEKRFREEARKRGARVYSEQKSKDAVELILSELEKTSRAS